jgi:lipoprotein LprG
MPRSRAILALASLLIIGLTGCSKDETSTNLPDGTTLVSQAATAVKGLNTAHVRIDAEGEVGALPLRSAEGDLTRAGDAKGSIKLMTLGVLLEVEFVVVGDAYYIKGVSGGWQKQSAADVATFYDPSAILDNDRGVAKILATATNAKTEAADSVDGTDTYRVAVKLDSVAVATVVPGVPAGVTGTLWVERESKRLIKALLTIPGATGGKPGTVTIRLTDLDKPVTISAP